MVVVTVACVVVVVVDVFEGVVVLSLASIV